MNRLEQSSDSTIFKSLLELVAEPIMQGHRRHVAGIRHSSQRRHARGA
jgi:hypothetical protein